MDEKPKGKMRKKTKGKLEEFSTHLIRLGKGIESKLKEKKALERLIEEREVRIRELEKDIFVARTRLAKLAIELGKLETEGKDIEKQESPLKKQNEVI